MVLSTYDGSLANPVSPSRDPGALRIPPFPGAEPAGEYSGSKCNTLRMTSVKARMASFARR